MTYQTFNAWIVSSSKLGNKTLQKACVKTFGLEITNLSLPKMLCLFEHVMMLSFKQTHLAFFPFPTATAQTLFKWVSTVAMVSVEKWFLLYNHFWDVCFKKKKTRLLCCFPICYFFRFWRILIIKAHQSHLLSHPESSQITSILTPSESQWDLIKAVKCKPSLQEPLSSFLGNTYVTRAVRTTAPSWTHLWQHVGGFTYRTSWRFKREDSLGTQTKYQCVFKRLANGRKRWCLGQGFLTLALLTFWTNNSSLWGLSCTLQARK